MQNKRGISQAFSQACFQSFSQGMSSPRPEDVLLLRPATVFDVFEISEVLVASIGQLCQSDHGNEPKHLSHWCANMAPGDIRDWIAAGQIPTVAVAQGRIVALGLATQLGEIAHLYVAPWAKSHGVGRVLLSRLEAQLVALGHGEGHLVSTKTAHGFYLAQGWKSAGEGLSPHFGLWGHVMRKVLQAER
jgi:GNAT superfamily N-acetyltransferase